MKSIRKEQEKTFFKTGSYKSAFTQPNRAQSFCYFKSHNVGEIMTWFVFAIFLSCFISGVQSE